MNDRRRCLLSAERPIDWVFRSRTTGQITIAQLPNAPLVIFLGTVALRHFVQKGTPWRSANNWIGTAALGWWAILELVRGVNPWRRFLGLMGCAFVSSALLGLT